MDSCLQTHVSGNFDNYTNDFIEVRLMTSVAGRDSPFVMYIHDPQNSNHNTV